MNWIWIPGITLFNDAGNSNIVDSPAMVFYNGQGLRHFSVLKKASKRDQKFESVIESLRVAVVGTNINASLFFDIHW